MYWLHASHHLYYVSSGVLSPLHTYVVCLPQLEADPVGRISDHCGMKITQKSNTYIATAPTAPTAPTGPTIPTVHTVHTCIKKNCVQ